MSQTYMVSILTSNGPRAERLTQNAAHGAVRVNQRTFRRRVVSLILNLTLDPQTEADRGFVVIVRLATVHVRSIRNLQGESVAAGVHACSVERIHAAGNAGIGD